MRYIAAGILAAALLGAAGAGGAGGLTLAKVDEDATTITLGWAPVAGSAGYRFESSLTTKRPHTWDPARSTVRFLKGGTYKVVALLPGPEGTYPPPPPVEGTVFVATNGNDGNPCTSSQPCKSFQRGYEAASPGDVVEVAAGNYPLQRMVPDPSKTSSSDVIIQPAAGATVKVAGLELGVREQAGSGPKHLTIRDIGDSRNPQGAFDAVGTDDVTFERLDAGNFYTDWSSNFTVRGGDWGPCTVPSSTCSNSKLDTSTGSNILIDGARFHDYRIVPNSGEHFECLIMFSGRNVTVRGSTFTDCEFYNIFVQHPAWAGYAGPDGTWPRDILLEGNSFSQPWENGRAGVRNTAVAFSPRHVPFYGVVLKCNTFGPGAEVSENDDGDGTPYQITYLPC